MSFGVGLCRQFDDVDDLDVLMLGMNKDRVGDMCDPTALLDLVPDEGLLKRPCMDYNEYSYCHTGGRG